MKFIYKTDVNHSYASRDLIGVAVHLTPLELIQQQVKKEDETLDEDQVFNIGNIGQTQGYSGEGEFDTEEIEIDILL